MAKVKKKTCVQKKNCDIQKFFCQKNIKTNKNWKEYLMCLFKKKKGIGKCYFNKYQKLGSPSSGPTDPPPTMGRIIALPYPKT